MARRIAALVDETVDVQKEVSAFAELENLGDAGVPYLVGHLADSRPLPIRAISLTNKAPGAFEGLRDFAPETVHDALAAILNQLTGQSFGNVYNGASRETRQNNVLAWRHLDEPANGCD